jgi:hypothetical protein
VKLLYKPEKYEFYTKEFKFLGYIIILGYLGIDLKKVIIIKE